MSQPAGNWVRHEPARLFSCPDPNPFHAALAPTGSRTGISSKATVSPMCRMLGVVSAFPRAFALLLEHAPRSMALLSQKHPDGWGVALSERNAAWTTYRSLLRAYDDTAFHQLATSARGEIIVAHVRQKTQGDIRLENTHPFQVGSWVFTHNGTIRNVDYLSAHCSETRNGAIRGDTDSERLLAFLLTKLDEASGLNRISRSDVDHLLRATTQELSQVPDLGTASFLLSDGSALYAHRWGAPLFLLQRTGNEELGCSECSRNPCIAVTTEPLTDENWLPLQDGDLVRITRDPTPSWTRL
jgi:predicted glutamine amidotransferase